MRAPATATLVTALTALATLTACGAVGGDAGDVPTITTQPSASSSSAPTTGASTTGPTTGLTTGPTTAATSAAPTIEPTPSLTETAGPSPEPPTDDPVGPTTYREASARIRQGGPPIATGLSRFTVDDDLIYCLLDDPVIGPACELRRGFIEDDVCGGAAEGVGRVETFEGRSRPVCNSDTIREPGAEAVLGDGVVSNGRDVRCLVEGPRTGVTCVDLGAKTGFFLAPGEYHVF